MSIIFVTIGAAIAVGSPFNFRTKNGSKAPTILAINIDTAVASAILNTISKPKS